MLNIILFYDPKEKNRGLYSNFYPLSKGLVINGEKWLNSEAYFQAMKFRGPEASARQIEYSNLIRDADTPMKTMMLGNQKKKFGYASKWILNKKIDTRFVNDIIDEYKDVQSRQDWAIARIIIMVKAVSEKFTQYQDLKDVLTNLPDNTYLVEHTARDQIWGDGGDGGDGTIGANYLGKILTALSFVLKYGSCELIDPILKEKIQIRI